jgi:hypothetical protein
MCPRARARLDPDLDDSNKPGMKQVGGLTVVAPSLGAAPQPRFSAEQRAANGTVVVRLGGGGHLLTLRTWAHATEPLLLTELAYTYTSGGGDGGAATTDHQRARAVQAAVLDVQVEAWTVLGCGMGPNPLVEDSFLPVSTGATNTTMWASRSNGFEYQNQPGVYNVTTVLVASAVISGAPFEGLRAGQHCVPAAAARHYGGTYLPCAVGNLSLQSGAAPLVIATVVVSDRQLQWASSPLDYATGTLHRLRADPSAISAPVRQPSRAPIAFSAAAAAVA